MQCGVDMLCVCARTCAYLCICVCVCVCVCVCGWLVGDIVCDEPDHEVMQSCCAGEDCDLSLPDVTKDSAKLGAESCVQQPAGQHTLLQVVRAGCAVVTFVFLWCNRACEAHRMQKALKQV